MGNPSHNWVKVLTDAPVAPMGTPKKMMNNKTIIPKQLHNLDLRFCLINKWDRKNQKGEPIGKAPFEKAWQKNGYKYNSTKLSNHISQGGNYGVIGGYGKLIIVDIDDPELGEELEKQFDTFTVRTGGGGRHFYFIEDEE